MEQMSTHKRSAMWYTLPILGAAVPTAVILARRALGAKRTSPQAHLLHKSNLSIQDAMDCAVRYVPGTPIEVELEQINDSPVWQVEVVPEKGGPVREVLIDAKNGSLLEITVEFEG